MAQPITASHVTPGLISVPRPIYRLVLLGDSRAGKTTLVCQLAAREEDRPKGLHLERSRCTVQLPTGEEQPLDVWDASASEMVQHFSQDDAVWDSYLKDACVLVLVYSDRSLGEIDNVEHWLKLLRKRANTSTRPIALVHNQASGLQREHHRHMLETLARQYRCMSAAFNLAQDQEKARRWLLDVTCTVHYAPIVQELTRPMLSQDSEATLEALSYEHDVPRHDCRCIVQ